jgi:hypothetical protein
VTLIASADRAAVAQFLTRLLRLDPGALVRIRPEADGAGQIWAMLPFRVLVGRRLTLAPASDATVAGAELAAWLHAPDGALPRRRDEAWRWPLPSSPGRVVETIPVAEVAGLAEAAARTVRSAIAEGVGGRAVGERALRDALLDHVAIVVTSGSGDGPGGANADEKLEIPQRMVQALVRAGLLPEVTTDTAGVDTVAVRRAMGWISLSSRYGSAWYRPISPLRLS